MGRKYKRFPEKSTKTPLLHAKVEKAGGTTSDLKQFYISVIRPICEYAAPIWSTGLTNEDIRKIENIQKRAVKIIFPDTEYAKSLEVLKLSTLQERRINLCQKLFKKFKIQRTK